MFYKLGMFQKYRYSKIPSHSFFFVEKSATNGNDMTNVNQTTKTGDINNSVFPVAHSKRLLPVPAD